MMNLSTFILVGTAAASVTPSQGAKGTGWPKYTSGSVSSAVKAFGTAVVSADLSTNSQYQGLYGCLRNGGYAAPYMKTTAPTDSAVETIASVSTAQPNAYYNTTKTKIMYTGVQVTTAAAAALEGEACCNATTVLLTNLLCPSLIGGMDNAAGGNYVVNTTAAKNTKPITNRYAVNFDCMDGCTINGTAFPSAETWWTPVTVNAEMYLAAQFQVSWDGTGTRDVAGVEWCDQWKPVLDNKGTAVVSSTEMGLSGKSKCTYNLSATFDKAPAFKVTKADYANAVVSWIEFANSGAMAAKTELGDTDSTFKVGKYVAANGPYLNPFVTGTINGASVLNTFFTEVTNNYMQVPGSIGNLAYYVGQESSQLVGQKVSNTMDSGSLLANYAALNTAYNSYNTVKGTYDTKVTTYNDAVTKETARTADFFKAAFEPAVAVPERPCPPTQPVSPDFLWPLVSDEATAFASWTATQWDKNQLTLNENSQAKADNKGSYKMGNIQLSSNYALATDDLVKSAGHIMGRLGQGSSTVADATKGFIWKAETTGNNGMYVSFFPQVFADAGLATTKKLVMSSRGHDLLSASDLARPSQPSAASDPACYADKKCPDQLSAGASMIVAGATGALAVLMTLA